jgi:small subunit ribosomal protein S13
MRIAGVEIPSEKPVWISLTYIYGIGRKNVLEILEKAKVEKSKRAKELTDEEIARISKVLENFKIEGELRKEVSENIKRLKEIGTYRGIRHARNLPVRGQRTRSNARTKRGKRVTIGAMRKEALAKMEAAQKKKT